MTDLLDAVSKPNSLTSVLKSYFVSLILHASLVAALYAIPAATAERFSSSGQTQVIAINATLERPVTEASVSIEPEPTTFEVDLDALIDRTVDSGPAEPRDGLMPSEQLPRRPLVDLQRSTQLPDLPKHREMMLRRRPPVAEQPETKMPEDPPRPKTPRVTVEPPSPAASAVEQLVGLEKEASVDLSSNKPPDYPQEAIRKRWEGVVLLRLTVDRSGAVTRVDLLESSGHPLLDETAIQAVSTWKGTPAKRWGRAVESTEQLPIRFRL